MNTNPRIIPAGTTLPPMLPPRDNGRVAATPARKPKRAPAGRGGAVRRRFALLNTVVDEHIAGLRRSDLVCWLVLYRHARPDGTVTASIADLARRGGCSRRAVTSALRRLQAVGLLERQKRGTLAGGPSRWRLLSPETDAPNAKRTSGLDRKRTSPAYGSTLPVSQYPTGTQQPAGACCALRAVNGETQP